MKVSTERLIPMEGARNVRDMGGFTAKNGVTRMGVFFRGDSTADLTENDIGALEARGLSMVIDLRSSLETLHAPSRLQRPGIEYVNVQMLDHVNSGPLGGRFPASMGEVYEALLEHDREDYRYIFTLLADCTGAALFHCTAGKDRTGVVAMLLLDLAGVAEKQIIEDYVASDAFMRESYQEKIEAFAKKGLRVPAYALRADRENIVYAIRQLRERFGGAESYLRGSGLEEERIRAIRKKFITAK